MKLFSQRKGLTEVKTKIQVDSMDDELRNCLWNVLHIFYWEKAKAGAMGYSDRPNETMQSFLQSLWHFYFKQPIDTLSSYWSSNHDTIRKYFFVCPWYAVYDFIEFVANEYPEDTLNDKFVEACNVVLENELSGFRFVGKQITSITSKEEITEIEEALRSPFKTVNAHLENAIKLMSDRKSPDHRNSIKESISAVEAMCRIITGDRNAALGKALGTIEREGKMELHGTLKKGFESIYGYTSSGGEGIRHAYSDEKIPVNYEDAKFMLVSCSAFVNYLISKASKAGLKIGEAKT